MALWMFVIGGVLAASGGVLWLEWREQHTGEAGEQDTPRGERRWSPGAVLLVGMFGLFVAIVLSADQLLQDSEQKPFGRERDAWVAIWEPVEETSDALHLDGPGHLVDHILDREDRGDGGFDFPEGPPLTGIPPATATATPSPTPPLPTLRPRETPTATPTATPTPSPTPIPPWEGPLNLWVGGDSLAGIFGLSLIRLAGDVGPVESELDYRVATGLTRLDYFNWPAHLLEETERLDPDVVVVMFGANDPQGIRTEEGTVYQPFEKGWLAEYRRRVAGTMDLLTAPGRLIVWAGMPVMGPDKLRENMTWLNPIFEEEAALRDDVEYLDCWEILADEDGEFRAFLTREDGSVVKIREGDGVHMTSAGGDLLAEGVLDILEERIGFGKTAAETPTPAPGGP